MPVQLPLDARDAAGRVIPNYRVGTMLGGVQYVLDVRWNGRASDGAGAWYLDISTSAGVLIRAGIKIVLGALLGRRSVSPDFPRGVLIAADLSGAGVDATLDDLGTRVVVYFYTFDELA
jgi:hypothetical protein